MLIRTVSYTRLSGEMFKVLGDYLVYRSFLRCIEKLLAGTYGVLDAQCDDWLAFQKMALKRLEFKKAFDITFPSSSLDLGISGCENDEVNTE